MNTADSRVELSFDVSSSTALGPVQRARALERLAGHKIEWLTETDTAKGRQWRHYRAPDGNVYEVMGPIDPDRSVRV